MEEKRKYVVYLAEEDIEKVVFMTFSQAEAIRWFMEKILECEDDSCVELIEKYEGEEI